MTQVETKNMTQVVFFQNSRGNIFSVKLHMAFTPVNMTQTAFSAVKMVQVAFIPIKLAYLLTKIKWAAFSPDKILQLITCHHFILLTVSYLLIVGTQHFLWTRMYFQICKKSVLSCNVNLFGLLFFPY